MKKENCWCNDGCPSQDVCCGDKEYYVELGGSSFGGNITDIKPLADKCECKKISCKKECKQNHTHKGFFCEKCEPPADKADTLNELVRDLTKSVPMPKSEARRRIGELVEKAREEGYEE